MQPTLTTERLILRPFVASDAPDVQRLVGHRAIADTTLAIPHPYPEGAAEEWIATHASRHEVGTLANFAITLRSDGVLVGAIGLHRIQAHFLLRNPTSGRVLEKIGMRREGIRRHAVRKWDAFEDLGACAILATDREGAGGTDRA